MKQVIKTYLLSHFQDCFNTFKDLWRTKMASLMTLSVVGIALALPTSFLTILTNVKSLAQTLEGAPQISVFLNSSVNEDSRLQLEKQWQQDARIAKLEYISKESALKEFSAHLNVQEVVNLLPENPLPAAYILYLKEISPDEKILETMIQNLRTLPEVENVHLDLDWVKRLASAMKVADRLVTGLTTLLALAVLLVIGNTLRLHVENKKDVIEVSKLVGATDNFVRRPFLYLGFWYGILGASLAVIMVLLLTYWINLSATELLMLYQSNLKIIVLGFKNAAVLLLLGALLGLAGAWLAVGRHLRTLQPT